MKIMKSSEVMEIDNELKEVESKLESIGRKICDAKGGYTSYENIKQALTYVQEAIRTTYYMDYLQN